MLEFAAQFGYLGIILFLILTGFGMPLPEELAVIAAGMMSAQGVLNVYLAFAACMAGALVGDCVMYFMGYHFGHNLVREHPRFAHLLHADRQAQIEWMIRRHGLKVFLLARFLVGIRGPVYLAAGTLRVPFRLFLIADAICATLVVGLFFALSYVFADEILGWFDVIRRAEGALTVLAAVAALLAVAWYWRKHRRSSSPPASSPADEQAASAVDEHEHAA